MPLDKLRKHWEAGKVLYHAALADKALTVSRNLSYFYCYRYFPSLAEGWAVSVDQQTTDLAVVFQWLAEHTEIRP